MDGDILSTLQDTTMMVAMGRILRESPQIRPGELLTLAAECRKEMAAPVRMSELVSALRQKVDARYPVA